MMMRFKSNEDGGGFHCPEGVYKGVFVSECSVFKQVGEVRVPAVRLVFEVEVYENGELNPLKSLGYAEFLSNEQIHLLNVLNNEFSLHPWSNLEERIGYLQSKYLNLLQLRDQKEYFDETSALTTESYSEEMNFDEIILLGYQDESDSYDTLPPT